MLEKILAVLEGIHLELQKFNGSIDKVIVDEAPAPKPLLPVQPAPTQPQSTEQPAPPLRSHDVLTRETVGRSLLALAEKSRDAAVAALNSVGAKALGEVKAEQYPALMAAIQEASK